jgi:NADH-quinone oxidoreductase subunit M
MDVTTILLLLLIGSIATYFSGEKLASKVALIFSLGAFGLTLYLLNLFQNGTSIDHLSQWIDMPKVYFAYKADGLSLAMVLLTNALTPLIVFSSFGNHYNKSKNFYALVLFMTFAMTGTFLASDGLLYYVYWELALLPIYFIALIWGNDDAEKRKKAVLKFFIYTLAGSLFMLVGFAYLYTLSGSFLLEDLYRLELSSTEQFCIFLAFFAAYAIKIPIIPFHSWQASVYQKAPTVGTMLLSGVMLKMGLYSIAGVIYGSIVALRQKDLKKLLAYSSLAHVGLIAAGCYTLTLDGLNGAVYQMIAHGFVIVGLFFCAEIIFRRYETRKIADMSGIRSQTPKFSSMFMILVLASVALPGTYNFVGEFTVLYSLSQVNLWFAVIGGTTIILGAYYMLRMYQNVMLGDTNSKAFADVTVNEAITLIVIIGFLLFFGLYPKPFTDLVSPAIETTLNQINSIS